MFDVYVHFVKYFRCGYGISTKVVRHPSDEYLRKVFRLRTQDSLP
jgi:hypothetical protein